MLASATWGRLEIPLKLLISAFNQFFFIPSSTIFQFYPEKSASSSELLLSWVLVSLVPLSSADILYRTIL
jgi:hypothetical protein